MHVSEQSKWAGNWEAFGERVNIVTLSERAEFVKCGTVRGLSQTAADKVSRPSFQPEFSLQHLTAPCRADAGKHDMTIPAELQRALRRASLLYLTTFSAAGRSGTVPVLFLLDGDVIYFCSQRNTLKVRRIQQTGRVRVHPGGPNGPGVSCRAELLENVPELEARLLRTYRRRYPLRWLVLGRRLRRSFAEGTEVVIRLDPEDGPADSA